MRAIDIDDAVIAAARAAREAQIAVAKRIREAQKGEAFQ
jgi:hypothetical protein